jgi:hypothetical protein
MPRRQPGNFSGDVKIILLIFFTIGAIAFMVGAYSAVRTHRFLAHAVELPGRVVDYATSKDDDGKLTYYPVIEYTDSAGRPGRFKADWGSNYRWYSTGEAVTVLYDAGTAAAPGAVRLSTFWQLWSTSIFATVFGVGFCGFPVVLWLAETRLIKL